MSKNLKSTKVEMGFLSAIKKFIYPARRTANRITGAGKAIAAQPDDNARSIHGYKIPGIDGKEINFSDYTGKKILLVNTASECGFTPQYAGLQKLFETYKDRLIVIGFPSNNFGAQEPGTENDILHFCERNYGVTFPLSKKIDVAGPSRHPVFEFLTRKELNGWNDRDPNWNFCKYLVDEKGRLTDFFSHKLDPLDEKIVAKIKA